MPSCPRCFVSPLRYVVASGNGAQPSGGGGAYVCACGYATARDELVTDLLRELRSAESLLGDLARLALPRLLRCASGHCTGASDEALERLRDFSALVIGGEHQPGTARNGFAASSGQEVD